MKQISVIFFSILSLLSYAQEPDTLKYELEESAVVTYRKNAPILGDLAHTVSFSSESIKTMPRMFGDIDPVAIATSMPGIRSNSLMDAGLFVHGFEDSHNCYSIAGAPVYLTPRMLGFFPTLNQSHFSRFRLRTDAAGCYLGGSLASEISDSTFTQFQGEASIGLLSAKTTLKIPMGEKVSATISARRSFLNTFYKKLLVVEDEYAAKYGFTDANVSLLWKPNSYNTFDANAMIAFDDASITSNNINVAIGGRWLQGVSSLRWRHYGEKVTSQTLLYGNFNTKYFHMEMNPTAASTPTAIAEAGLRSSIEFPHEIMLDLSACARYNNPVSPTITGKVQVDDLSSYSGQIDVNIAKKFRFDLISITPSLNVNAYGEFPLTKKYLFADPGIQAEFNMLKAGKLTISGSRKHQYISEIGLMASGIPFKFWINSGKYTEPQESYNINLAHSIELFGGKYSLTTQAYGSRVFNQLEFRGFMMDMIIPDYKLEQSIVRTKGFNYGANIMLSKNSGKLTGWLSYSYSRAIRTSDNPELPDKFPASHDRPHELNAMLSWNIGQFDLGATVTAASGSPYTRPKCLYFVGENIMAEYEPLNSSRLAPMFRLDLSVNYNFKTSGRFTHGLNLSLINATGYKNETARFIKISQDNYYYYAAMTFILPVLPSISYYCKF